MGEALRNASKSVLDGIAAGVIPRLEFYNKFQQEMDERDWDFEKKYGEGLNTTIIFVSICSYAVQGT